MPIREAGEAYSLVGLPCIADVLLRAYSSRNFLPERCTKYLRSNLHVSVFPAPLSPLMTTEWFFLLVLNISTYARCATAHGCGRRNCVYGPAVGAVEKGISLVPMKLLYSAIMWSP